MPGLSQKQRQRQRRERQQTQQRAMARAKANTGVLRCAQNDNSRVGGLTEFGGERGPDHCEARFCAGGSLMDSEETSIAPMWPVEASITPMRRKKKLAAGDSFWSCLC